MATKAAKKKSARKKKAKTRTAKKKSVESNGAPTKPAIQKMLHSDAFPERDENIEGLLVEFREANTSADAAIAKAEDHRVTAQKALKEAVRAAGLDSYKSYDIRFVVELKKLDDRLKVRPVKQKEPTPCAPASVVTDEEEETEESQEG